MYAALDEVRATIEALSERHLELLRQGILTPRVFCRRRGQPILSFRKRWLAACQAAGRPGRVPHDFRRHAGSWIMPSSGLGGCLFGPLTINLALAKSA
jgi:integrase